MKLKVLTAAVLATLASGSVLAASEGSDIWSTVQPVQQSTYSGPPSAPRPDVAFQGSEGSGTLSSVDALPPSPRSFTPALWRAASGTGSADIWSNDFAGESSRHEYLRTTVISALPKP